MAPHVYRLVVQLEHGPEALRKGQPQPVPASYVRRPLAHHVAPPPPAVLDAARRTRQSAAGMCGRGCLRPRAVRASSEHAPTLPRAAQVRSTCAGRARRPGSRSRFRLLQPRPRSHLYAMPGRVAGLADASRGPLPRPDGPAAPPRAAAHSCTRSARGGCIDSAPWASTCGSPAAGIPSSPLEQCRGKMPPIQRKVGKFVGAVRAMAPRERRKQWVRWRGPKQPE